MEKRWPHTHTARTSIEVRRTSMKSRTEKRNQAIRKYMWKRMPAVTGKNLRSEDGGTKDIGSGGNRGSMLMVGGNGDGDEDVVNALSPFLEDMGNGDNFSSVPLASVMEMDMQMFMMTRQMTREN